MLDAGYSMLDPPVHPVMKRRKGAEGKRSRGRVGGPLFSFSPFPLCLVRGVETLNV
jgi:hypothetical protein